MPISETKIEYSALFKAFFKIGLMTWGKNNALVTALKNYTVDKNKWIDQRQFDNMISIAESCPGIRAINISVITGYTLRKTLGGILAALGLIIPSAVLISIIAMIFLSVRHTHVFAAMFRGIRPAVAALLALPTFNLAKRSHLTWANCWIPVSGMLFIWLLGLNPILIIIAACVGGFVYGKFVQPTEEK